MVKGAVRVTKIERSECAHARWAREGGGGQVQRRGYHQKANLVIYKGEPKSQLCSMCYTNLVGLCCLFHDDHDDTSFHAACI